MTAILATDQLEQLIVTKRKVLELLADLVQRQLNMIERGNLADLLKILSAKQTVLAQLHQIERKLDPFRGEDPDAREWRSAADRARCRDEARRCDTLLQQSMQWERQSETAMVRRRDAAGAELQTAHAAADACTAYSDTSFAGPSLAEVHCEG